jgi:hypothetical protein
MCRYAVLSRQSALLLSGVAAFVGHGIRSQNRRGQTDERQHCVAEPAITTIGDGTVNHSSALSIQQLKDRPSIRLARGLASCQYFLLIFKLRISSVCF